MNLRKLKFDSVGAFGGNMTALEAYRRGYQILMSDCFGNPPEKGEDWGLSIYKKRSDGDYDENPTLTYQGKNYSEERAEKTARGLLGKVLKGE